MEEDAAGLTHHGDGPDGCSYCEAIADAEMILATDARAKAEAK